MKSRPSLNLLSQILSSLCWHEYTQQIVEGWNVNINRKLLKEDTETTKKAIDLLALKLKIVKAAIPVEHHLALTQTVFWLEKDTTDFYGMVYHPSSKWLKEHGYNPKKARAIEISNIQNFIKRDATQPWHVLHELAHVYHHQVITYDFQPIIKAYKHAKTQGLYQRIPRNNGQIMAAYAITNFKEYFAELTEAYFGNNDFFPFNREQLKGYDNQGYLAIKKAWKIYKNKK